ncbi:MAG: class I SAM-dependent methyltransferase [Hyphomicrobiales bacterium]
MSAIAQHDAMVAAYNAQRAAVAGESGDIWTGALANRFREDPRRELDPSVAAIAGLLRPDDVFVDAGGGAGRVSLPMALRCRQVLNVDPSEGMREVFESVRAEAGIENAQYIKANWLDAEGIEGDVALACHVTYFVPDIRTFIEKLTAAARRTAAVMVYSVPPPNSSADLFLLEHGQQQSLVPGHDVLVPVLWEMGYLPEIRVLPLLREGGGGRYMGVFPTKEAAIDSLKMAPGRRPADEPPPYAAGHFDELFVQRDGGWVRRPSADARPLLITWQP